MICPPTAQNQKQIEAEPGFPPGALRRVDYRSEPHALGPRRMSGTHGIGLSEALMLAERLDILPREVWVHAIAAERFEQGEPLSEGLRRPLADLVRSVRSDVLAMLEFEPSPRRRG